MTMAIPARQRWIVYAIMLLATVTAIRWAGGQDRADPRAAVVERPDRPAREVPAAAGSADAVPTVQLERLERRAGGAPAGDPFQARSWEPPPTTVKRSLPPPPPQAPPLPFAYLGKLVDGEQTTVFLAASDRNYVARAGDTLDGRYRVESIAEDGLALTYLPLGTKQVLPFAATAVPVASMAATKPRGKPASQAADDEDDDE
jgi:hypothetical protein